MIDWTPIDTLVGATGTVEFRKENNGLVRLRGTITKNAPGTVGTVTLTVPNAIACIHTATLIGWADLPDRVGAYLVAPTEWYLQYFASNGPVTDLSPVVYWALPEPEPEHSLANVQTGLADALRTIAGLRVYDFPSDRVETPAAVLSLPETPYDVTLGGRSDEWSFPLWVLVAKADDKAAYGEMAGYLEAEGPKSIRAVVEADRTLGGACDTAAVVRARPLFATVAGTEFLAVEFTLEVYT